VNGRLVKPSYQVQTGDWIQIDLPEPEPLELIPEEIPLDILYEDEVMIVLNKPAGLVVHPAPGHPTGTLVHALLSHCQNLSGIGGIQRPGIVHRLDRDTSGVMLVAKTDQAHQNLSTQLKNREIKKEYLAVVHGIFKDKKGTLSTVIGRHIRDRKKMSVFTRQGRPAVTSYEVIEEFQDYSLVKIQIYTGRTHQIRVHMKYLNHPVVGDPLYGRGTKDQALIRRQALHAKSIAFKHPITGHPLEFEAPLPQDMKNLLEKLRTQYGTQSH
jgi:23S rRNA pseudouridine1911/1915/1917 synthase